MLVYHVTASGSCEQIPCAGQGHLLQLVAGWRLTHVVHHAAGCVVHCPPPGTPLRDLAVVFAVAPPCPVDRARDAAQWVRSGGHGEAYRPLCAEHPHVRPTPNGGSARQPADLADWVDDTVDCLLLYHVLHKYPPRREGA